MGDNKITIGLLQTHSRRGVDKNLESTQSLIESAAKKGAKIICTQELYRSDYFCFKQNTRFFDLAETIPGPSTDAFSKLAKKHKVVIIASLFEKRSSGVYHNTAVVIDADGKLLGLYRKMHIPDDPGFNEKFYFVPGDLGFKVFKTRYADIGVLICWDQWYPEAARLTALKGAQILFYPTAIGWKPSKWKQAMQYHDSWHTAQRAHAIANGVFVASVNRVGVENGLRFWGKSFISDPFGKVIASANDKSQTILTAACDLRLIEQTRREWPFMRDRRIDAYDAILKRSLKG